MSNEFPIDYYPIKLSQLKMGLLYPFNLYLIASDYQKIHHINAANFPLGLEPYTFIDEAQKVGGILAIKIVQKNTFLKELNLSESEHKNIAASLFFEIEQFSEEEKLLLDREIELKNNLVNNEGKFNFSDQIKKALPMQGNDDFFEIIRRARLEISSFSPKRSELISLSIELSLKYLYDDNLLNRKVAFAYFLAKECGITDQHELAQIFVGTYTINASYTQKPKNFFSSLIKIDKKDPIISEHLLNKITINEFKKISKIALECHERIDGSGFPRNLNANALTKPSQIVGITHSIFDIASGKISGTKFKIRHIINVMNRNEAMINFNYSIDSQIIKVLVSLFDIVKVNHLSHTAL